MVPVLEKKVAIAGLISLFKPCHVGLPQVSESMSFPCLVSLASTGMSYLWWQVGKGVGSMLGEAVHIKLLPIKPPPIDSMPSHIPAQE